MVRTSHGTITDAEMRAIGSFDDAVRLAERVYGSVTSTLYPDRPRRGTHRVMQRRDGHQGRSDGR